MFQFAADNAWLIPALPLLACALIGLLGSRLKGLAHIPAILAMIGSCAMALSILFGIGDKPIEGHLFSWFSAGDFHVDVAYSIDHLTALYLSFITGIGLLIFIYAAGYMKGDFGYWRFFAYLSIFVFFMCCLVMGSNFILLYLGWEGVGLASYLLIGYYYPRPSAVAAAKKAFITNRIGDFGLAIGIFLIYKYFGSVDYRTVLLSPEELSKKLAEFPALYWVPFCLMLGAFGKSAQFPLHVWLPDAMEGPTPVSALIHAATMVTAGIYLIARTMPLFLMDSGHDALHVVACIGGFTAFLAASIAFCQYDLKRIWAYSTLSQLGYMFLALGVVAPTAAVFHVFTHAFFKALLFLSAGSVMHAMGGELDIRKMSGVRKVMPITNITMLIGCLALAGFPGLAGFFSKDEIIHAALNSSEKFGFALGIVGLIVALMTAFYTFRLYFKVFTGPLELPATAGQHEHSPFDLADDHGHGAGDGHGHDDHGHDAHSSHATPGDPSKMRLDGSPLMWLPLVVLSLGAIFAGYLGTGFTHNWFEHFLSGGETPAAAEGAAAHEVVTHSTMLILGCIIPLVGIAAASYFYLFNRKAVEMAPKPLVSFLFHKWYWDEIYSALLLKPLWLFALFLSYFDRYFIDGLVWIVGFIPQFVGYTLKPTQRGLLQRYAVGMIAGLAAIVLGVLYLMR